MDSKWSLSPPKLDKKPRKNNKQAHQLSKPCLTDPNHPHNDILRSTEQTLSNAESPSMQISQQHKEASALDYLRDMSEESNEFGMASNVAQLDDDLNPLNTSDRLSPFMDPKKKRKEEKEKAKSNIHKMKSLPMPTTGINVQIRLTRQNTKDEKFREESKKRVRSEPNEGTRNLKAMQGKSYQFVYPKYWSKGAFNKISYAANIMEDENSHLYEAKIEEKMLQNDFKGYDNHGAAPVNSQIIHAKEEENNPKLPSVLQIKKLVGRSYSQFLHDMKDIPEMRTDRQLTAQETENINQLMANRMVGRKAFYPKEKKILGTDQHTQKKSERIMMVGRSLSVPKIPPGIEKLIEKTADKPCDYIGDQRYKEEDLWRRLPSPDSKNISTYNNTRANSRERATRCSDINTRPDSPIQEEEKSIKHHKPKAKSETPGLLTEDKKGVMGDLNHFKDQKIIDDMKKSFRFKSKKTMIDIVSPEEEVQISRDEKLAAPTFRDHKRENSIENKAVAYDKSLKGPKLKLHHLAVKKPKEPLSGYILPEIQETLRLKLKLKDINSNTRDIKPQNSLSRKSSIRDVCLKAEMQTYSIKIPKFKAILKAVGKNIESERLSSLLKPSEREMASERPLQAQALSKRPL